jgi:hypothetical protein
MLENMHHCRCARQAPNTTEPTRPSVLLIDMLQPICFLMKKIADLG